MLTGRSGWTHNVASDVIVYVNREIKVGQTTTKIVSSLFSAQSGPVHNSASDVIVSVDRAIRAGLSCAMTGPDGRFKASSLSTSV